MTIAPAHRFRNAEGTEGLETFDSPAARSLNRARMEHLDSLGLPLSGKSVLDVGCGVGHLAQYFVERGCRVHCADARRENIERLQELYPGGECGVFDLERQSVAGLGKFDVVFSYGLLYHLENPFRALRELARAARELLLLETIILDHDLPMLRMDEETDTFSQALHGIGGRPSPSFVALALREAGIPHVYAPRNPPDHPDFRFQWRNDLSVTRDGHPIRCVFVGSRVPLLIPKLVELLKDRT